MKTLLGMVAALSLVLVSACHSTSRSQTEPDASPMTTAPSASSVADGGAQADLIVATGYVVRLSNGTIMLDSPTPPTRPGWQVLEFTHYELQQESEIANALSDRLTRLNVVEFPLLPRLTRVVQEEVPATRLLFSTRYCEATRSSPLVATVRGRVIRVEKEDYRVTPQGTTFHLVPTAIVEVVAPFEAGEWVLHYAKTLRSASAKISRTDLESLERALYEINVARDLLKSTLRDAATDYEAFRFIDGLSKDLRKGIVSESAIDFGPALRVHPNSESRFDSEERQFLLREEKALVLGIDTWIHDYAAKAFAAETDPQRAHEIGAIVIKADEMRLGPRTGHDYLVPPRIPSPAAKRVVARFPDLDPSPKRH